MLSALDWWVELHTHVFNITCLLSWTEKATFIFLRFWIVSKENLPSSGLCISFFRSISIPLDDGYKIQPTLISWNLCMWQIWYYVSWRMQPFKKSKSHSLYTLIDLFLNINKRTHLNWQLRWDCRNRFYRYSVYTKQMVQNSRCSFLRLPCE